jgi:hypothetical protein
MALNVGTRLGPYEIVSAIGAGGMSACGHTEPRICESEARCLVVRGGGGAPPPVEEKLAPSPCR